MKIKILAIFLVTFCGISAFARLPNASVEKQIKGAQENSKRLINEALEQTKQSPQTYRTEKTGGSYSIILNPSKSNPQLFINICLDDSDQTITLKKKATGTRLIEESAKDAVLFNKYIEVFNAVVKVQNEEIQREQTEINATREQKNKEIREKRELELQCTREKEAVDEQVRKDFEKKNELRLQHQQEEEKTFQQEINMVDAACKKAGYKGLAMNKEMPLDMFMLIYLTQQTGGLENYLNTVVGNLKNDKDSLSSLCSKIKAFQILDDGVLYAYKTYINKDYFDMTVYIKKEDGRLYQEGQSLEDTFYVFNGMYTYITTTGARKTIPSFSKAKLKLTEPIK